MLTRNYNIQVVMCVCVKIHPARALHTNFVPVGLTGVEEMLQSILLVIAITFVRDRVLDSVAILDANSLQVRGVGLSALCDKIVNQRSFRSPRLPIDFCDKIHTPR